MNDKQKMYHFPNQILHHLIFTFYYDNLIFFPRIFTSLKALDYDKFSMCAYHNREPMVKSEKTVEEWLVVFTRPRAEVKLMQDLETLGHQCFLPMIDSIRKWSDRIKKLRMPLLPGIVFVKTKQLHLPEIYKHHHARFILKEFGKPAIVRQEEIDNLRIIAREWDGKNISTCVADHYNLGDYVRIKRGNFKGLSGRLTEIKGRYRLLIQLSSADLAFSVNIPASQAEKIAPKREMQVS